VCTWDEPFKMLNPKEIEKLCTILNYLYVTWIITRMLDENNFNKLKAPYCNTYV
jgi:hypothetical protein